MSFKLIDDVLLADKCGRGDHARTAICNAELNELGPVVEFCLQQSAVKDAVADLSELVQTDVVKEIRRGLSSSSSLATAGTSLTPLALESLQISANDGVFVVPQWIAYSKRLQAAAKQAGFATGVTAQFVGAFIELVDNAITHGGTPNTILTAYSVQPGQFSYCVADNGVGILNSLRRCSHYSELNDYCSALETAVQDGESRLRNQPGRGRGFRQVQLSLASLSGSLRFRSGDYALELNGRNLTYISARLSQKAFLQGFAASISCDAA